MCIASNSSSIAIEAASAIVKRNARSRVTGSKTIKVAGITITDIGQRAEVHREQSGPNRVTGERRALRNRGPSGLLTFACVPVSAVPTVAAPANALVRIEPGRAEARAVPMIAGLAQTVAPDFLDRVNCIDCGRNALPHGCL